MLLYSHTYMVGVRLFSSTSEHYCSFGYKHAECRYCTMYAYSRVQSPEYSVLVPGTILHSKNVSTTAKTVDFAMYRYHTWIIPCASPGIRACGMWRLGSCWDSQLPTPNSIFLIRGFQSVTNHSFLFFDTNM